MRFFVDESGTFRISPYRYEHRVGVVSVVSVVDEAIPDLEARYLEFVRSLTSSELEQGEPKGTLLTHASQMAFCTMLNESHGIIVTPSIFDLTTAFENELDRFHRKMAGILRDQMKGQPDSCAKSEMEMLARQFANLSVEQAIRLWAWASGIYRGLFFAVMFQSKGRAAESWQHVKIQIDRVGRHPERRENLVFQQIWKMWWGAWSQTDPILIVDEWYPVDHPIRTRYDVGPGLDVQAMLGDSIEWVDSRDSPCIQIADITASIVSRAAVNLKRDGQALQVFANLMRSSCHGPNSDRLLILPGGSPSPHLQHKYECLSLAMRKRPPEDSRT